MSSGYQVIDTGKADQWGAIIWHVRRDGCRLLEGAALERGFSSYEHCSPTHARLHAEILNREMERGVEYEEEYVRHKAAEDLSVALRDFSEGVRMFFPRLNTVVPLVAETVRELAEQDLGPGPRDERIIVEALFRRAITPDQQARGIQAMNLWLPIGRRKLRNHWPSRVSKRCLPRQWDDDVRPSA